MRCIPSRCTLMTGRCRGVAACCVRSLGRARGGRSRCGSAGRTAPATTRSPSAAGSGIAVEESGFDLVAELGGEVGEHIGMLGAETSPLASASPNAFVLANALARRSRRRGLLGRDSGALRDNTSPAGALRPCSASVLIWLLTVGFEAVEQPAQAAHRMQHGDHLGGAEGGDIATQDSGEVGVWVVRHRHTLSNICSISATRNRRNLAGPTR